MYYSRSQLIHCISGISDEAIVKLNLPTGIPFIFEFDSDFNPVVSMKFLSDEDTVKEAIEKVASIGQAGTN
jgi:2,3-bisphosphoglycerate-dependent phosphoglycerate mutase